MRAMLLGILSLFSWSRCFTRLESLQDFDSLSRRSDDTRLIDFQWFLPGFLFNLLHRYVATLCIRY